MSRRGRWLACCVVIILARCVLPAQVGFAAEPAPEPLCTIQDQRLGELSGLVAGERYWYAVNDGGTRLSVFVLTKDCRVDRVRTGDIDPYDVEDLARGADGTLWLADTGDNRKRRDTVALHAVPPEGEPRLYRLTYPDGQHDAEALLLDREGTPYIVTKNVLGHAGVYRPAGALTSPGPTALERAGSLDIAATDTPGGPVGAGGSMLVTGAATHPDGSTIAVRTYTDAYLYPAPDGDVLAALQREPVRVPLAGEQQGEAIAFEADGTLLSASEGVGQPVRAVAGAAALVAQSDANGPNAPAGQDDVAAQGAAEDGADVPTIPAIAIAVLLSVAVVFGLSKLRRNR